LKTTAAIVLPQNGGHRGGYMWFKIWSIN